MKIQILIAGVALAVASMASQAATNIVTNGSFEAQQISSAWTSLASISGWTSTDSFEIQRGSNFGGQSNFNTAIDGQQYLELNGRQLTTVSQNLSTTTGGLYQLNFLYSGRPDQITSQNSSMDVLWNGTSIGSVSAAGNSGWKTFSFSNLAAGVGGATLLSFQSTGPTGQPSYGSYLDGVSVSAVPEPGISAMMVLGLGMIAFAGSRRNKQTKFDAA
ncbi:DUF642 domain-containing protein [Actimicrobium antarcticum]|uniref:PEP-CTERM protein-sorting domain-containing protein n=1 Tax=Actimicrobium antarcticum TaxID=1051899 RepID=A0ABP7TG29_9BURK